MGKPKKETLSIRDGALYAVSYDFDTMVENTIANMLARNVKEANVTLKLSIELRKTEVESPTGWKEVTVPMFEHEIKSGMHISDKQNGKLEGDYVIENENGMFILHELEDGQLSMFDEDDK